MNLLQLVLKQMRQRLLSTVLTTVSILLGVALAVGINVVGREGRKAFSQTDYGYDLIVGPKASPLQLVMNTVYGLDQSPGTIPYGLFDDLRGRPSTPGNRNPFRGWVKWAVPLAVGDSFKGAPIIGTTPALFGVSDEGKPLEDVPEYREGRRHEFAQGRAFAANRFEAVVGSEAAAKHGLRVGSSFQATHGFPNPGDVPDMHAEQWTVVGVLKETHTAADRALYIPLQSFYAITEHEETLEKIAELQGPPATAAAAHEAHEGHDHEEEKAYRVNPDGTFTLTLPKEEWRVSAVLVKAMAPQPLLQIQFVLRNRPEAVAVSPATVMQGFFDRFLPATSAILVLISMLVTLVAGIGILVSIYNSVTSRLREIAILRALGATRGKILAAVCLEGVLVGFVGALLGTVGGHLVAAVASMYLERAMGISLAWWRVEGAELWYVPVAVGIALLASLVPARKAYGVSVAEHLA